MKEHWDFLKENDSSFGLFYPLHYIVASFETIERAEKVREQVLARDFAHDDVAAVPGSFVIEHLESQEDADWFDRVRAGIARVIGTEAGFLDDDLQLARRGGAFLFIYTPDNDSAEQSRQLMKRLHPMFARRYHQAGIESIHYPPQSTL